MKPIIITDSNCDLAGEYLIDNNIPVIPFFFHFKDDNISKVPLYNDIYDKDLDCLSDSITYKEFYDELRNGQISTTSQISPHSFEKYFRIYTSKGHPIIYIGFSSALSGTLSNAILAQHKITEENKEADITIIDSKRATSGQGLLVYYASEMLRAGKSKDEIIKWVEENKLKVNLWFTVDSLEHLKRGGRISATSANIGTVLDIKPVLKMDSAGKLVPSKKVRGRKRAVKELFEQLKENIIDSENQTIFINHGDCIEDAEYLEKLVINNIAVNEVIINYVGPIVGTHTGPGVLAIAFLGQTA